MNAPLSLDYWGLVTRSFHILWKHKFLWFFGFFATAAGGSSTNSGRWTEHAGPQVRDWVMTHVELLAMLVMVMVIVWFVFFVMGLLSKGALIGSIAHAEREHDITFGRAWEIGYKNFLKMLGLAVIALIVFLVAMFIFAIPIALPLFAGKAGVVVAIAIAALLFIPFVAFAFLLAFTVTYAEREAVLRGQGVFDSLRTGWELTKTYFWNSMVVWLVSLVSGIVFAVSILFGLLLVAVPFILIGLLNVFAALVVGIPIGLVLVFIISGALGTYDYSLWTLAYVRIRDHHDSLQQRPGAIAQES
jgi:hypothetical protein